MKARNIALIGLGVLVVGGGALYFLKAKGIIGENVNSGGARFLTAEEVDKELPSVQSREGYKTIEVVDSAYGQAQLALLKQKYPAAFSGFTLI